MSLLCIVPNIFVTRCSVENHPSRKCSVPTASAIKSTKKFKNSRITYLSPHLKILIKSHPNIPPPTIRPPKKLTFRSRRLLLIHCRLFPRFRKRIIRKVYKLRLPHHHFRIPLLVPKEPLMLIASELSCQKRVLILRKQGTFIAE